MIDTDPGVDDALALLLALRSPELRVEAIITVNGNVPVVQATKNAALVLDLLSPELRPILAKGAAKPLKKGSIRAQDVHGADGLGELDRYKNPDGSPRYPYPELPQNLPDAIEVLLDLLRRYPDELCLIT
ncbi:MAG: nucleoside hydrolase, partial [Deltaproteobacteria bacterium]